MADQLKHSPGAIVRTVISLEVSRKGSPNLRSTLPFYDETGDSLLLHLLNDLINIGVFLNVLYFLYHNVSRFGDFLSPLCKQDAFLNS